MIFWTRAWKSGSPEGCILYYVVDGGCALELSDQTISLKKAGVCILNLREAARLDVPKGCLGVLLSMDYFAICEMYSRAQIAFTMSCSNKRYDELCSRMQLLLLAYAGGGHVNVCRELNGLYSDLEPLWMELVLETPAYHIRQRALNAEKGSVLDKWAALDCAEDLTRSDPEYLERTAVPEMLIEKAAPAGGELRLKFRMEPNEMRMIIITA